jgi:hypothetical protein
MVTRHLYPLLGFYPFSPLLPTGLYFGMFCTRNAVPCKLFAVPGTTTPNSQKSLFVVSGREICPGFFIWMPFLVQGHGERQHDTSPLSGNRSLVLLWGDLADVHQSHSTYAVIMKCNWRLQVSVSDDLIRRILLRTWIFRRVLKIVKSDHLLRRVCLSVCPSAPPHVTSRSHWTDCREIIQLSVFF